MNIRTYYHHIAHRDLERLIESLEEADLDFFASEFVQTGMMSREEMQKAVLRSVNICRAADIPVQRNFKAIFVCKKDEINTDWLLSPLARKLVMINAPENNPASAMAQVELICQFGKHVKV